MQFSIFSENSLYLLQKINPKILQPLSEFKVFWPTAADFLLKYFFPICEDSVHDMTLPNQLTPKQMKVFQTMTAYLQNSTKSVYQGNGFRLRILGNKKVLKKSHIGWSQMLVPSLPSRNKFLVTVVKNYTEADLKS